MLLNMTVSSRIKWLFPLLITLLFLIPCVSASYQVNPGKWVFYLRDQYEFKTLYFNFNIKNEEKDGPITVSLKTIPPNYLYSSQYPGIVAFPDYSWIDIAETSVVVPANSSVDVPVRITFPEQYYPNGTSHESISNYNKSYEAWFQTQQTAGPGNIFITYNCRWVFLTPPKYVPPWQRPGAFLPIQPEILYAIIIIIIVVIVAIWLVLRNKGRSSPSSSRRSRRKSKGGDDFFT